MENLNSREYLEKIKVQVLSNLERTRHTPSVQMTDVGKGTTEHQEEQDAMLDDLDEDTVGMDRRSTQRQWERRVEKEGELSDSEDEDLAENLGVRKNGFEGPKRRRNEHNFGMDSASASGAATPQGSGSDGDKNPATALGYQGEHDAELEALAKEDIDAKDDDGDVEMGDDSEDKKEDESIAAHIEEVEMKDADAPLNEDKNEAAQTGELKSQPEAAVPSAEEAKTDTPSIESSKDTTA